MKGRGAASQADGIDALLLGHGTGATTTRGSRRTPGRARGTWQGGDLFLFLRLQVVVGGSERRITSGLPDLIRDFESQLLSSNIRQLQLAYLLLCAVGIRRPDNTKEQI